MADKKKPEPQLGTYSSRRRARVKTILERRDVEPEVVAKALNVTVGYVKRVRGGV